MTRVLREGAFEGETHIVTGAGQGIGNAVATALAEHGAQVVLVQPGRPGDTGAWALPGWLTPLQGETPHDIRLLHGEPAVRAWVTQLQRGIDFTRHTAAALGVPIQDHAFG